ncbi:MAG: hypothetical protein U0174_28685 [Polyangiaceae bacterium]
MKRAFSVLVLTSALAASAFAVAKPADPKAGAGVKDAPTVNTLTNYLEEVKWNATQKDLLKIYNEAGGILDKDYDPLLRKVSPGVQMKALEAERDGLKRAFERSLVEFKDVPTGLDSTPMRGEFTYKNRESLMSIQRPGKRRVFFFFGDRIWKIYDEVQLGGAAGLGATYAEAITKLGINVGATGRSVPVDPAKGVWYPTTDWQDATTHMRVLDRSGERIVGIVLEDRSVLQNLAQLRANKPEDIFALDPSIAAVTKGGISDPNAASASPSASGTAKPKPKK